MLAVTAAIVSSRISSDRESSVASPVRIVDGS